MQGKSTGGHKSSFYFKASSGLPACDRREVTWASVRSSGFSARPCTCGAFLRFCRPESFVLSAEVAEGAVDVDVGFDPRRQAAVLARRRKDVDREFLYGRERTFHSRRSLHGGDIFGGGPSTRANVGRRGRVDLQMRSKRIDAGEIPDDAPFELSEFRRVLGSQFGTMLRAEGVVEPVRRNCKRIKARLEFSVVVPLKAFEGRIKLLLESLRRIGNRTLRTRERCCEHDGQQRCNKKWPPRHWALGVRASSLMGRPAAESLMSWFRRFWRVSSCLALITRYEAVRRYQGGCA